ncbi:MAG TPA: DUF992 domain-containing protein [Xanthobacteraceae bacterium]
MSRFLIGLVALTLTAALAGTAGAQSGRAAVGTLTCDVSAGFGVIVGSRRAVNCAFAPSMPGAVEHYSGTITKVGLDIGATTGGVMVWLVYAPTTRASGAVAGSYGGATAEATIAVGLGANVLVGGSNRTVALQPLSVQGQTGLNLAIGVAALELRFVR